MRCKDGASARLGAADRARLVAHHRAWGVAGPSPAQEGASGSRTAEESHRLQRFAWPHLSSAEGCAALAPLAPSDVLLFDASEMPLAVRAACERPRAVVCLDLDCFYAQVEEVLEPALRGVPLGVTQKNIIVTCNYPARRRGLHKLMLITDAVARCPDVVLRSGEDLTRYRAANEAIAACLAACLVPGRASSSESAAAADDDDDAEPEQRLGRLVACALSTVEQPADAASAEAAACMAALANALLLELRASHLQLAVQGQGLDEFFVDATDLAHHCLGGAGLRAWARRVREQARAAGLGAHAQSRPRFEALLARALLRTSHLRACPADTPECAMCCASLAGALVAAGAGQSAGDAGDREADADACLPPSQLPDALLLLGALLAWALRAELEGRCGYSACAGIGSSKLLAKFAVNMHKPRAQTLLHASAVRPFMAGLPLSRVPGIGRSTSALLAGREGARVVREALRLPLARLCGLLGDRAGRQAYLLIRGLDDAPVSASAPPSSYSVEDAFRGCTSMGEAQAYLGALAALLVQRAQHDSARFARAPRTLVLKFRLQHERPRSRRCQCPLLLRRLLLHQHQHHQRQRQACDAAARPGTGTTPGDAASEGGGTTAAAVASAIHRCVGQLLSAELSAPFHLTLLGIGADGFEQLPTRVAAGERATQLFQAGGGTVAWEGEPLASGPAAVAPTPESGPTVAWEGEPLASGPAAAAPTPGSPAIAAAAATAVAEGHGEARRELGSGDSNDTDRGLPGAARVHERLRARGWDEGVFLSLPPELQHELLGSSHSGEDAAAAGSGAGARAHPALEGTRPRKASPAPHNPRAPSPPRKRGRQGPVSSQPTLRAFFATGAGGNAGGASGGRPSASTGARQS